MIFLIFFIDYIKNINVIIAIQLFVLLSKLQKQEKIDVTHVVRKGEGNFKNNSMCIDSILFDEINKKIFFPF